MTRYTPSLVIGMLSALLVACGSSSERPIRPAEEPRPKIGLLMDTLQEERWQRDRDLFLERAKELGADVLVESAERDDANLRRRVALKLPHAGPGQDTLAQRLLRERDALVGLEHPNIARLYDVVLTSEGVPCLVLEYVQGDPIDVYADRGGALIPEIVAAAATTSATIRDLHISEPSLENLFLHHTGRSLRE